ncbi:glycosyltransferase [Pengzhenrongella sp.]|jgi:glycosyltransferase involved in cell wall biosynthesis|uniref:glycosyltransferase n=1 Tax=Pengzhenrongella sp. TaxID=2888820 RepID=UPI002F91F440
MSSADPEPIDPRSRAARTIRAFYRVVETCAPAGSLRRRAYRAGVRGLTWRPRSPLFGRGSAGAVIDLRSSGAPRVSVIVLDDGHDAGVDRCLAALERHPPTTPYEVILLSHATAAAAARRTVAGVRLVHGEIPSPVAAATRLAAGAGAVRSELAVVLSSRAEVAAGSLDALVRAADERPDAMAFGALIVSAEGRVRHAGVALLPGGRRAAYREHHGSAAQEFAFRRDIDGCSAAVFAVRTAAIPEVVLDGPSGCVEFRSAGDNGSLRMTFEPAAVVVLHDEDLPRVPDATPDDDRVLPAADLVLRAVRRRVSGSWVVVVDVAVPKPDRDAGSVRLLQMLLSLRADGHGVLFVPHDRDSGGAYGRTLTDNGIEVLFGPVDLHSRLESMGELVTAVILARATVAWPYLLMVRRILPDAPVYFDTVDLHFLREERADALAGRSTPSPISTATRELELALVRASDRTFVVSPIEQELLSRLVPGADVRVIPLVQPAFPESSGLLGRDGVVFVGGFDHEPNVDGVGWFLAEVLPLIRLTLPACTFSVVGRRPPARLVGLAPSGVEFLGWVADLAPVYAGARVAVAPLRFGAGVKGKVVEAMSYGVPVVATGIGVEGMPLEHDVTTLIADGADAFASEVVRLLQDDAAWVRLARSAREVAENTYAASAFEVTLRDGLGPLGAGPASPHNGSNAQVGSPNVPENGSAGVS